MMSWVGLTRVDTASWSVGELVRRRVDRNSWKVLWAAGQKVVSKYYSPSSHKGDKMACQELNLWPFGCLLTEIT